MAPNLNDLLAFRAVARERSFTRAAAQLGVSQSALSQTLRALEERLGLRLLTRTTRSVATTEAGERLLQTLAPALEDIESGLAALNLLREKPAGTIRITAHDHAVQSVLWPALLRLLPNHPDITIEIIIDYGLTDIVAERFDAGKQGRDIRVHVQGPLIVNATAPMLEAALAGFGLAYVPEDTVQEHIADGRLMRVLEDWCPAYPGYHLYYPSRRQPTPAFVLLVEALRPGV
jgi:DNA-binding transcriptional LysR family regulator